ncbi:putative metalloprotease CJM1_0395 family protein [Sulfurimonas microaerophilic]|uniref:putative metalloprotease CJM1_0395 family protein n=1 Tax=Sulfurimonas microaerophilic TaxID=3058392 RepID=UPI002714D5C4|nr:putative metalloprotease CJM1_0395 family protein [Sulfurimonas sp. hsl 1-7]
MQIGSNNSYNTIGANVYQQSQNTNKEDKKESSTQKDSKSSNNNLLKLDASEQQQVNKLQARDSEVRAHEAAHKAAGGGLAGSASFSYQKGPDGKMYAIGGEVPISFKEGSTPQETITNARQVVAAAMAPANPSPQDYSVASSARMVEMQAQQELVKELQDKLNAKDAYSSNQASNSQNNTQNLDIAI